MSLSFTYPTGVSVGVVSAGLLPPPVGQAVNAIIARETIIKAVVTARAIWQK
jgi:hypothetical protein